MYFRTNKDILRIGRGIIDLSLPKADWTHAAHFAAAIHLLSDIGDRAFSEMPNIIRNYNVANGVENTNNEGYHETITIASLKAAQAFMYSAPKGTPQLEIVNTLLASDFGHSGWILDYWSKDLLFTPLARREWVDPDLSKLPF